jgi:mannan polymerase II complex MNN10 subunit
MSLSRSPSPCAEGGWSSPGLTNYGTGSGRDSPSEGFRATNSNNITWAGAKKKSEMVNGGHLSQNGGFFKRHMRSLSNNLPTFNIGGDYYYTEKEKPGQGRWTPKDGSTLGRLRSTIIRSYRQSKIRFMLVLALTFMLLMWWLTRKFEPID